MKLVHYIIVAIALTLATLITFIGVNSDAAAQVDAQNITSRQIMVMIEQPANHIRAGAGYSAGYGDARQKKLREKLGQKIAKKYGVKFLNNWPMPILGIECFIMEIPADMDIDNIIGKVSTDKLVSWVEPVSDYGVLAAQSYNDPLYPVSPAGQKWKIADLHSKWTGRNISIAIIDTQIDTKHPDLLGSVSTHKNFTPKANSRAELHGTSVAGVIAATANNGIGIAGIAPDAKLIALRACWQSNSSRKSTCNTLSLARALNYAIQRNVNIINLSLGGPQSIILSKLIDKADAKNIAIVAAYDKELALGGFPASHDKVIAVSADDGTSVSRRGFKAPGNDIPTTRPGGQWYLADGSSYATAHVSGLLALMHECQRKTGKNCKKLIYSNDNRGTINVEASLM